MKANPLSKFLTVVFIALQIISCKQSEPANPSSDVESRYVPKPYVEVKNPEWVKNATMYEVNIRQYTPEGTFKAFEAHLPRLKELGVDILWLMPIHPIGEKNRKGGLGSYYSVKDYLAVNPEFGTMDDFKALVKKIHEMGMYVILDWVANHSAWDNPLTIEHPEWYTKTREGNFQPTPWYDWDDIIDFDFDQPGLRKYMTEAMKFWVKEADIDGYRCDVAGFIPIDFWENARAELDEIKPVFMLAEWESRDLHRKAFDATYAWSLYGDLKNATKGGHGAGSLYGYMANDAGSYPKGSIRLVFTDNHDKNSWDGTQYTNFGDGLEAAIVFTGTVSGMPLAYSGQEAGLNKSLAFFEKDQIEWKDHSNAQLFKKLFDLKHRNQALWNGHWGGETTRVKNDNMQWVLSFAREKDGYRVLPIINFSDKPQKVKPDTKYWTGTYTELFTGQQYTLTGDDTFELKPWGYVVMVME